MAHNMRIRCVGRSSASPTLRGSWKEEELQKLLCDIMTGIHDRCAEYGRTSGDYIDYVRGANIGAFIKGADAMLAYGVAKS